MQTLKRILPLLLILALSPVLAPAQSRFEGTWEGKLNVGVELRIVFHVKSENGKLSATMDSPDQSAFGIPCDSAWSSGDSLHIDMNEIHASFSGNLVNDTLVEGTFTQRQEIPLQLLKVNKPSVRNRPQTPQPPFPYLSEDVIYKNADQSLQYGATLTLPAGNGPFPAAILITGSGPQNRDEELFGHKIFAVVADHLTRQGFAVLRVDDRGVGQSTGSFDNSTTADFAKDVSTGVDYLLSRKEVDKNRIGLIGHSEGGMIAPMVATDRKDIDFIILLAGPGVKIIDLLTEQTIAIMRSSGVSQQAYDAYRPFYRKLLRELNAITDTVKAKKMAYKRFEKWARNTKDTLLKQLGMEDEGTRRNAAELMVRTTAQTWFRYFLNFDPKPYLQQLSCKVMALNGDKDIQVIASQNMPGIEAALASSKAKNVEMRTLPGLNHLFQSCKQCTIPEYQLLEETFAPEALRAMSDWLGKYVLTP